jgi:hypothetical protein
MATPPARTELADTYPNPSNSTFRTGIGKLYDYVSALLGATGNAADARAALGLVIGTHVVPKNGDLGTPTAGNIGNCTGANDATARTALSGSAQDNSARSTANSALSGSAYDVLARNASFYDQTWNDLIGSRSINTVYTNTTGRFITVRVMGQTTSSGQKLYGYINSVLYDYQAANAGDAASLTLILPAGATYRFTQTGSVFSIIFWSELR